jgi:hypothetical protein
MISSKPAANRREPVSLRKKRDIKVNRVNEISKDGKVSWVSKVSRVNRINEVRSVGGIRTETRESA